MAPAIVVIDCEGALLKDKIGGLTLIERAVRIAATVGCTRAHLKGCEDPETYIHRKLPIKVTLEDAPEHSHEPRLYLPARIILKRAALSALVADRPGQSLVIEGQKLPVTWTLGDVPADGEFHSPGWAVEVKDNDSARRAEAALWQDCRKPLDGVISKHLNRYISLAISRRIAASAITPDMVTFVTFALGFIAAGFAAWGGYVGFLLAGVVFQANSVLDGVDGELARTRYEFSVRGEWLDTISDDLSDVLFWAGLGIGAYRTFETHIFTPWEWLAVGAVAVVFKIVSMALYYRWLRARGRGDLLAFTWDFDDGPQKGWTALLSKLRYVAKKDFIVFAAMILGFAGILPWLLWPAALGNIVVAYSVYSQS